MKNITCRLSALSTAISHISVAGFSPGTGFVAANSPVNLYRPPEAKAVLRRSAQQTLWRFLCFVILLLAAGTAFSLPPVSLTDDQQTGLDLSTGQGARVDVLDCQLRVEGIPPRYELVHSGGRLPIPRPAVKQMQDSGLVEVKVTARLGGLPITRLWLPYTKQKNRVFTPRWGGMANDGKKIVGNSFNLLIEAREQQVLTMLRKERSTMTVRLAPSTDPASKQRIVSALAGVVDELDATGYGIESWTQFSSDATTVDYQCAIGAAR